MRVSSDTSSLPPNTPYTFPSGDRNHPHHDRSRSWKSAIGSTRRSTSCASVSRTVTNCFSSGSSSGPPSSTPLSNAEHCLHGRHRIVTNSGRPSRRACSNALPRSPLHLTASSGAGSCTFGAGSSTCRQSTFSAADAVAAQSSPRHVPTHANRINQPPKWPPNPYVAILVRLIPIYQQESISMPGMTMTEKILAKHAGKSHVEPAENVWVNVDILMTHDVCGPGTIGIFHEKFGKDAKVWDPDRVVVIPDHYIFTAVLKCHRNVQTLRDFVKQQGLRYYYDPDFVKATGMSSPYLDPTKTTYKGVCHKALPEEGHVRPGEILLGTDSHTCTAGAFGQFATGVGNTDAAFVLGTGRTWLKVPPTMKFMFHGQIPPYLTAKDLILAVIGEIGVDGATYKAVYFAGEGVSSLTLEDRMTLTNMAIEAGGKNGVCDVDEKTLQYVRARSHVKQWEVFTDDKNAA